MAEPASRHEVTRKAVVYPNDRANTIVVRRGLAYNESHESLTFDVYYAPEHDSADLLPGVVLVTGLADRGAQRILGCRISEMESFISWARLIAASGLAAITYTTEADAAEETRTLVTHLRTFGPRYGLDSARLAVWACSSHVPNALGVLIEHAASIRCGAFSYGFMLDLDGATGVREAQQTWHFANPAAGKTIDDFPPDIPLLVVRAGNDTIPSVNESIDAFVPAAIRKNLPITFVNHHTGPHAFDLDDDTDATRHVIELVVRFFQWQLRDGKVERDRLPEHGAG